MLDERPDDRRRPFRSEGDAPASLVLEVVHLLADDVGRVADPLKDLDILEHGRHHQAVAGGLDDASEVSDHGLPPGGLWRQDVVSPDGSAKTRHGRSRVPGSGGGSAAFTGHDAVGVEHAVEPLDGTQQRVEVGRVGQLELEPHSADPVGRGVALAAQHVQVMVG